MSEHNRVRCQRCRGKGRVPGIKKVMPTGKGIGMGSEYGPCPDCDGVGYVQATPEVDSIRLRRHRESRRTRQ
jgi:hypothetical protein